MMMTRSNDVLIDKLMLATYFFKRQQSRVASLVQQRAGLAGRSVPNQHMNATANSWASFLSFQKQSVATRTLQKQLNGDDAATLKQRQEDIHILAAHTTITKEFE